MASSKAASGVTPLSHDAHFALVMTDLSSCSWDRAPALSNSTRRLDDRCDARFTKPSRSVEVVLSADEHFTGLVIVECVNSAVVSPVLLAGTCALQCAAVVAVTSDEVGIADLASTHETRYSLVVGTRMTHHLVKTLFTHRSALTSLGLQVRPNLLAVRVTSIDDIPQDAVVEPSLSDLRMFSRLKQDRGLNIVAVLSEMIGPVDATAGVRVGFSGRVAQVEQACLFVPLAVE
jgi:hypothetical protein